MGSADVKGIIYLSTNILQIYETIRAKANKDSDALIEHLLNLHVQWAQRRIGISVAETLAMRYYGIEQAMKMNSDSLMEHLISLYNGEFDEMKEEHADIEEYSQDALSNSNMADSLSSHGTSKEITYMSSSRLPVTSDPFRSSRRRIDRDQLPNKSSNVTDNSTFPSITGNSALPSISHSKVVGGRSNKGLGHFEMSSEYTERGTERRTFEQLHYPVSIGTTFNSASQPKDSQSFQPSSDLPTRKDKYYSQFGVSSNVTDIPNNMETLPEDFVIVNIKEEMDTSNLEATGDWGEKVGRRKSMNSMQQMTAAHGCETSSFTLTDSAQFQDLLQSVHGGGKAKTYTCFICQKQFRTLSTYRYHVPTHKNQQGFTCRQCNHTFPRLSLLRFHMRSHTENNMSTTAVHLDDLEEDTTVDDSCEPVEELEGSNEAEDQISVTTDDNKDLEGTESDLVDSRLDDWQNSGKSASTKNTDRWAVNRFQEWQVKQGVTIDFATVEPKTLAQHLRKFYAEIRTKEGKLLTPVGLRGIRCAIQRILMAPPYKRTINIVSDEEFRLANQMFEERCKLYLKWNDATPKHHPKIRKMDMEKLRFYFQPSKSPEMLQHTIWFLLFYNFGRRRLEKWNCMNKGSFFIKIDNNGCEYLTYNMTQSHQHLQDLSLPAFWDNDGERAYGSNGDGSLDIIQVYKFYLSKLNPKCNALFQRAKKTWEVDGIWFDAAPLGKNCLKEFMKNISKKASLSYIYTNHCVRVTAIADMYPEGTDPKQILRGPNKKSEESLNCNIEDSNSVKKILLY